ncbi:MAG: hypothetical protein CVU39_13435 [Chloroflexi bacterium HGW-Chloroflexi-10]|nr:MAG: hypothetical protein CVU39_13435 [Chloroflexi bacterium HGW-Chloroflexi-10]
MKRWFVLTLIILTGCTQIKNNNNLINQPYFIKSEEVKQSDVNLPSPSIKQTEDIFSTEGELERTIVTPSDIIISPTPVILETNSFISSTPNVSLKPETSFRGFTFKSWKKEHYVDYSYFRTPRQIQADKNGVIWVAYKEGLVQIDDDIVKTYTNQTIFNCTDCYFPIDGMRVLPSGVVWIIFGRDLIKYDNEEFTKMTNIFPVSNSTGGYHFLRGDTGDELWVADNQQNICVFENNLHCIKFDIPYSPIFNSIAKINHDHYWLGTSNGYLVEYEGKVNRVINISDSVSDLEGRDIGYLVYNHETKALWGAMTDFATCGTVIPNESIAVFEKSEDDLWKIIKKEMFNGGEVDCYINISSMIMDENGKIWLTFNMNPKYGNIFLYEGTTWANLAGQILPIEKDQKVQSGGIVNQFIYGIAVTNNALYVVCNEGIYIAYGHSLE